IILSFYRALHHRYLPSFPTRRSSDLILRLHDLDRLLGTEECAGKIDANYCAPLSIGQVFHRNAGRARARIIKENIQASELFPGRSEEHTSELQSRFDLVCRLLLEKTK